jgi:GT2 family glycosyltransferase
MKLGIVIVNFNTPSETTECLESLKKCHKPSDLEIKTILVDNGSSDDSVSVFQERYPEVNLIVLENNTGFAGGNNVGLRQAMEEEMDWYMLLNSDTEVPNTFLKDNYRVLSKTKFDVFSPKIYFAANFEFHKERYVKSDLGKCSGMQEVCLIEKMFMATTRALMR